MIQPLLTTVELTLENMDFDMIQMIAKVYEKNGKVEGGLVELSNNIINVTGTVTSLGSDEFIVQWNDGFQSVEKTANYELVVVEKTAVGPAAAWAVGQGVKWITENPEKVEKAVKKVVEVGRPVIDEAAGLVGDLATKGVEGLRGLRRRLKDGEEETPSEQ